MSKPKLRVLTMSSLESRWLFLVATCSRTWPQSCKLSWYTVYAGGKKTNVFEIIYLFSVFGSSLRVMVFGLSFTENQFTGLFFFTILCLDLVRSGSQWKGFNYLSPVFLFSITWHLTNHIISCLVRTFHLHFSFFWIRRHRGHLLFITSHLLTQHWFSRGSFLFGR